MGIKIVTDSTSYIPEKLINKYDITVVSLGIIMDGKGEKEVEINNDEFYKKLSSMNSIPTSSQPTIEDLFNAFDGIMSNGDDVIGIFISSKMSGTFSTCNQIIRSMLEEKYPDRRLEVIDSQSNCMQMGYAVLAGAEAAMEGKPMEEIISKVKDMIGKSRFLFVPDTLEYLKKGGRIGGASALFGSILQIRPILTVENGATEVFEKVRTKQKSISKMIDKAKSDFEARGYGNLIVHHINCEESGKALAEKIKEVLNIEPEIQCIGPVIGCHVGPKAVGIAYYTER